MALQAPKAEDGPWPSANGASSSAPGANEEGSNGSAAKLTEEDPENEFTGVAQYEPSMPRIINVGIDGPGKSLTPSCIPAHMLCDAVQGLACCSSPTLHARSQHGMTWYTEKAVYRQQLAYRQHRINGIQPLCSLPRNVRLWNMHMQSMTAPFLSRQGGCPYGVCAQGH